MSTAKVLELVPSGLSLDKLTDFLVAVRQKHGPGADITEFRGHHLIIGPGDVNPATCWCASCESACLDALPFPANICRVMSICENCGNKRCPRATHHEHECSGSNEPGQVGSNYGIPCICHRGSS